MREVKGAKLMSKIYRNPEFKEPVWMCLECKNEFATNYSLRRHMRLVHGAPKTLIEKGKDGVMRGGQCTEL